MTNAPETMIADKSVEAGGSTMTLPFSFGLEPGPLKTDGILITLYDSDSAFDDLIGSCHINLNGSEFDGALHTVDCPATADIVAVSVDYRIKVNGQ